MMMIVVKLLQYISHFFFYVRVLPSFFLMSPVFAFNHFLLLMLSFSFLIDPPIHFNYYLLYMHFPYHVGSELYLSKYSFVLLLFFVCVQIPDVLLFFFSHTLMFFFSLSLNLSFFFVYLKKPKYSKKVRCQLVNL